MLVHGTILYIDSQAKAMDVFVGALLGAVLLLCMAAISVILGRRRYWLGAGFLSSLLLLPVLGLALAPPRLF